jgi:hypothetical protein
MIKLGVDDRELDKGLGAVPGKLDKLGSGMAQSGAKLSRSVTLPILAAGAGLFALAGAQEEAEVKLKSSYDSMAAAGWTTLDELKAQASAFQEVTTFGDESILDFQSVLLTFGNVTGDVFTDATRLGLDMSAKLGTDLQGTAIQLGKALNDPVRGISALSRVGVSFTQDQKDMVRQMAETGDMAGAQALILGELEKQFGGTAEAMAQTGTGQAKQAMNALGDAGESIGQFLLPVVSKLAGFLKDLAVRFQNLSPKAKEWIVRIGAIAAAVGPVLFVGGKLISSFGAIGRAFGVLSKIFMANPWVLLIAAVVALVVIIVKNWDEIVGFLKGVWKWIQDTVAAVGQWFKDKFSAAVEFVKNLFLNFTGPGLLIKHWDAIKTGISNVVGFFREKWDAAIAFFKELPAKIGRAASGMWDGIKTAFKSAINWLIDKWNNFEIKIGGFKLPAWLGGGTAPSFTFNTPNIPRLHDGGVYRAPNGREGLAMLEDGERVTPRGGRMGPTITIGNVYGFDDFVAKVREAGVDINRLGLQT